MAYYGSYGGYGEFPPYVPVAARRARALAAAAHVVKGQKGHKKGKPGRTLSPVPPIEGNKIARSFWGRAWCENLEAYSDYANRLPRGRSYVRNGSVCHLEVRKGKVAAKVSGSEIYEIAITVRRCPRRNGSG